MSFSRQKENVKKSSKKYWLVVSTPLKNISQNGNLPQIGVKEKKYLKPPPRLTSSQRIIAVEFLVADALSLAHAIDFGRLQARGL